MPDTIYNFTVQDLSGQYISLDIYRNKVLLIVNVASKCGFTPQYAGLQALYTQYRPSGLEILGFPANNFLWQEPGSNADIRQFCTTTYNVTFPLFAKISIKGKDQAPLYRFLTEKTTNPTCPGNIKWNFTKFLINRSGQIVARFEPAVTPEDAPLKAKIEELLAE